MLSPEQYNNTFCQNCNNTLDVSRNVIINDTKLDTETPNTMSSDTKINIDYKSIIQKIENNIKPTNNELISIDFNELVKNSYYKKLTKKNIIKKNILDMIDDMENSDSDKKAFFYCNNCNYSKPITNNTMILSRHPRDIVSTHDYIDEASYRNKIHMRTMPRTRNFNCPNNKCPGKTNNTPIEAIFFRKNSYSYDMVYVCKNCLTIKVI